VGEPPTKRLAAGADLMGNACEHYASAAEKTLKGAEEMDSRELDDARSETDRAVELVSHVNEIFPPGEAQAVPEIADESGRSRIDPLYSRVAGSIAGEEVEVRCWSRDDWPKLIGEERAYAGRPLPEDLLGLTGYGSRRVNLSPTVCGDLDRLAYENWRPRDEETMLLLSYSVVTLAHEVQHRRGIIDEATADCFGMQHAEEAARGLGAPANYAAALAQAYWDDYANLEEVYRSRQCHPGGKLDLDADDPRWP
jgi:hypothetical protein